MKKVHPAIMVVEDDPDDQFFIKKAFQKIDAANPIITMNNGAEAIDYLKGAKKYNDRENFPYPTFIMTDLKMPQLDGFGVLEFLKNNPDFKVIPVVVFSASVDQDDIRTAYMLGASSYHVKPTSAEKLQHQLELIRAYWATCHLPEVNIHGKQLKTESKGKLGERFPQPDDKSTRPT